MFSILIAVGAGLLVGLGLGFSEAMSPGWSVFMGVLGFIATQFLVGRALQKRVKAAMENVQAVLLEGQKKMQAKTARWQLRPPGSIQAAQAELARDMRAFVTEALARTEDLHRFDRWVPMMARQIATAQFQLYWMVKDFKKADALMEKALFLDPTMCSMKLARMYMTDVATDAISKFYEKSTRRLRYNQNTLLSATYSWILLKRGDADAAFKALNRALDKSDNEVLKANRENLANNRLTHFSNAGLGDQWYSLQLEEPKIKVQRPRMQWR